MIIVAEDNDEIRHDIYEFLKKKDEVLQAGDGDELVKLVEFAFPVRSSKLSVLSDTDMPKMSGDIACKKLLDLGLDIPIIGMSDNSGNEYRWDKIGIWQTFILKIPPYSRIAETFISRLNSINSNPLIYRLENGLYRRSIR